MTDFLRRAWADPRVRNTAYIVAGAIATLVLQLIGAPNP